MSDEVEQGVVERFDIEAGLGLVVSSGGRRFPFHCTAIADGSRTIDDGRAVAFTVGPGGPGRWEACRVVPLHGGSDGPPPGE